MTTSQFEAAVAAIVDDDRGHLALDQLLALATQTLSGLHEQTRAIANTSVKQKKQGNEKGRTSGKAVKKSQMKEKRS